MYQAVELTHNWSCDKDFHRRNDPKDTLLNYKMTRVNFGVSDSSYAANMAIKQMQQTMLCSIPWQQRKWTPLFILIMDSQGLTQSKKLYIYIKLQQQPQALFSKSGFFLRKWNSSHQQASHTCSICQQTSKTQGPSSAEELSIPRLLEYTGLLWRTGSSFPYPLLHLWKPLPNMALSQMLPKTFDVLGCFSPSIIKAKVLMRWPWELKVDCDDPVPEDILSWCLAAMENRATITLSDDHSMLLLTSPMGPRYSPRFMVPQMPQNLPMQL